VAVADVKLPAIVGNSMVLQQQMEVNIWGWADAGEKVTVAPSWDGQKYNCTAGQDGKWKVKVKTPRAGGPYTLEVAGKNTLLLKNILIGEVWVCSGQSNMQFHLGACKNAAEAIPTANYPEIRLFTVERTINNAPQEDCKGQWVLCSPETANGFSGVGYFYGLELHKALGVPVGLINSSWGGTLAEAWTSAETLKTMPYFVADVERVQKLDMQEASRLYQEQIKEWKIKFYAQDKGMEEKWFAPGFDYSSWATVETPKKWDSIDELKQFDGLVWFCRDFEVDAGMASTENGFTLELGVIDDMDVTWVNGQRVGGIETLGQGGVPRKYDVPTGCIKAGKNTIAVRVHDWYYGGGFYGEPQQLKLSPVDKAAGESIPLAGAWHYKISVNQWKTSFPVEAINHNSPTALYNGMISPISLFGIQGAIWYQGESNVSRAYQYRELFPAMIKDWRKTWAQGDFPFYYVQIAPFSNYGPSGSAAELREAQLMSLAVANTGMAVTMDIGDPKDIHPTNKKDVSHRLALCALAKTYGKDAKYLLPVYKSMEVQGDKIVLSFDNTYGGLHALNGPLANFTIAGEDKKFVPAEATIDGDSIIVSSGEVKNPVAVRFAWGSGDESNLYNLANLSASSFRTDDWPGDTINNK